MHEQDGDIESKKIPRILKCLKLRSGEKLI